MKRGSKYNFQRVYPYVCKICKKKRGTRIYKRRIAKVCMVCKKNKVSENQMSLIENEMIVERNQDLFEEAIADELQFAISLFAWEQRKNLPEEIIEHHRLILKGFGYFEEAKDEGNM